MTGSCLARPGPRGRARAPVSRWGQAEMGRELGSDRSRPGPHVRVAVRPGARHLMSLHRPLLARDVDLWGRPRGAAVSTARGRVPAANPAGSPRKAARDNARAPVTAGRGPPATEARPWVTAGTWTPAALPALPCAAGGRRPCRREAAGPATAATGAGQDNAAFINTKTNVAREPTISPRTDTHARTRNDARTRLPGGEAAAARA